MYVKSQINGNVSEKAKMDFGMWFQIYLFAIVLSLLTMIFEIVFYKKNITIDDHLLLALMHIKRI